MPKKLDNLESDIVSLLEKHQPKMLRWTEIVKGLWETYRFKYQDEKGFGVAVTNKLGLLFAEGLVKHEDSYYGTPSSVVTSPSLPNPQFRDMVTSKFWEERPEVLKLREGGIEFGNGSIFEAWERTERFSELLPLSPSKTQLMESIRKAHDEVYQPGKIVYPRNSLFFTPEES